MTTPPGEVVAFHSKRGKGVLAATVLGSGMAQLDGTVVTVALPRIGTDLDAGLTSLQWTVNAYTLTLSGLLLLGGSLGDRLGRRRIFTLGVIWFTVFSIGCAAAPNATILVAMRAMQGVGAALLTPSSLAILQAVFRREDRGVAVGAWSGLGGIASAIGPVLGGLLVGAAGWGWRLAFIINVPLAIAVLAIARRSVPETRDEESIGRLDIRGAVLASIGLAALTYGLTEGSAHGWHPQSTAASVIGIAVLAEFLVSQHLAANPLMPLGLFADRTFSAANVVTLVIYAALSLQLFLMPVQLQKVAGDSPVAAGTSLLPVTVVMLLLSARMGALAGRIGPRALMTIGPIIAGIGQALLIRVGEHANYVLDVLPAVLVFGLGLSITVAPLTTTVLAAAPDHQAGVASAINNDIARVAGLLSVALIPGLAGITPRSYADPALLSRGFHHAVIVAACLCALGGVLSALTITNVDTDEGAVRVSSGQPPATP